MSEFEKPKNNFKEHFSDKDTLQDYKTEFVGLIGVLDLMEANPSFKGMFIEECRTKFEQRNGAAIKTFAEMAKEQYGIDVNFDKNEEVAEEDKVPFEEYKETIEQLNAMVEEINAKFADFFGQENITPEDEDKFIEVVGPLIRQAFELLKSAVA